MYVALKHQGKPLYTYARLGQDIPRAARCITISQLLLLENIQQDVTFGCIVAKEPTFEVWFLI